MTRKALCWREMESKKEEMKQTLPLALFISGDQKGNSHTYPWDLIPGYKYQSLPLR